MADKEETQGISPDRKKDLISILKILGGAYSNNPKLIVEGMTDDSNIAKKMREQLTTGERTKIKGKLNG